MRLDRVTVDVLGEDVIHVVGRRDCILRFWIPASQLQCGDVVELNFLQFS